MMVVSFKLNNKTKLVLAALAVSLVVLILASIMVSASKKDNLPKDGVNTAQRLEFLRSYGYTGENETEKQITIPSKFDDTYEVYNAIQIEQGYDLKNYLGKKVMVYTYNITDYEGEDEITAYIIVYNGSIIGGDISASKIDGFMHGIVKATMTYNYVEII